jgi:NAD(P)-dependent dehydrogenase (short-subunit alcohol dehydrogenase family)
MSVVMADLAEPEDTGGHTFQPLDVRSRESVEEAFDIAAGMGDLRAVVVSHGTVRKADPVDLDEDDMRIVIEVNLEGVARVSAVAAQKIADDGAIVNLSSIGARIGRTTHAFIYSATKAGVEAITRNYAIALGGRGVRVNAVAPGFVLEPMAGEGSRMRDTAGGSEKVAAQNPMGRLPTAAEVADTIAYLCSPTSSGISGVVIPVDTGMSAL